ncbi:MAG TPA: ABC transporter ATP-binding protein [Candidatus Lustribacter sp.]|jgi:NitT/TauT family transport system ATP-binding protein|nr:ABC transporter ATP-binding protein [Candidatus Lustribacter sp.]
MIEVRNVTHRFESAGRASLPVLNDVSLSVADGKFVSLLGPSGCGKTTLLRIIDGLVQPTHGQILIDGTVVNKPGLDRAMVFQEFNLLPWRTAQHNVEFALGLHGVRGAERRDRAIEALQRVGLEEFAGFYPHQLSGGMKQRVGLARALSTNPRYLLMDEPFGALDPLVREFMQIDLLKLLDAERRTIVFVTHSVDEAVFLSDRVIIFRAHPGSILEALDIDLPPRRFENDEAIKASPAFVNYRNTIWHLLKEQLRRPA